MAETDFIELRSVRKTYTNGEIEIHAVRDVSFSVRKGQFVVVVGPSGAGKTTVLNLLGGMDDVSSGQIFVNDREISTYSGRQLTQYRRHEIGFVFQFYNLVPNLTALENVELATEICADPLDPAEALTSISLESRLDNFPAQLSGGEQQRVAIARALAKNPSLLLCDEPTGALDDETGKRILGLLQQQSKENGMTVIIITHNQAITPLGDVVIRIKSGVVEDMVENPHPTDAEDITW